MSILLPYTAAVNNQFYSVGDKIYNEAIPINIQNQYNIQSISNDDEGLFCNDVWQTYSAPINGVILGRVCVVNNSFYCQYTYYRSIDIMVPIECFFSVE